MSEGNVDSDFEEKLISEVQSVTVLWNSNLISFRNNKLKDAEWDNIGELLGRPGADCRKRFTNMRDTYVKLKHKSVVASGSGSKRTAKWKYFDLLHFLDDVIAPRKTSSNFEAASTGAASPRSVGSAEIESDPAPEPDQPDSDAEGKSTEKKGPMDKPKASGPVRGKRGPPDPIDTELLEQLQKMEEKDDEDTLFGKAVGKMLSKYPAQTKSQLRVEIMQLFQRAENMRSFQGTLMSSPPPCIFPPATFAQQSPFMSSLQLPRAPLVPSVTSQDNNTIQSGPGCSSDARFLSL